MTEQTKPVVRYRKNINNYIKEGYSAYVHAYNHPVLGTGVVSTSAVLSIQPDGTFETLDIIYTPDGPDK
jgi:hypothetical protein